MPATQTKYRDRMPPSPEDRWRNDVKTAAAHVLEGGEQLPRDHSEPETKEAVIEFYGDVVSLMRLVEEDPGHRVVAAALTAAIVNDQRIRQLEREIYGSSRKP